MSSSLLAKEKVEGQEQEPVWEEAGGRVEESQ